MQSDVLCSETKLYVCNPESNKQLERKTQIKLDAVDTVSGFKVWI